MYIYFTRKAKVTELSQAVEVSSTNYYQLTGTIQSSDSLLSHLNNV